MMSKERELLKLCAEAFALHNKCPNLTGDINKLLAQPEEEGVYQKILRIEDGIEVEILPSELWQDGYEAGKRSALLSKQPEQTEQEPWAINENTSDGYHTFKELYEFRKAYNVALFNEWGATGKCHTHKSWRHHDGELCFGGGWFIVVAVLPQGQISNHYEAKDWDLFTVPEVEKALFEFDGHTGADVVERLKLYTSPPSRKPLNIEHILGRLDFNDNFEYRDGFIDGVLWAEQQHGIGGGE